MRRERMVVALLAIGSWMALGSVLAQHEQHQTGPATPQTGSQTESMMAGGMMSGGMAMCQQMMSGGMSCPHQAMKNITAQLVSKIEAIETEQDPALLKAQVAELRTLVKELQAKAEEKCPMMVEMGGPMMTGPMMGGEHKTQ